MTFNTNTPLSSDPIRQFPGDVTTNQWPRLKANIETDHNFSNSVSATQGYHKVIHFVDQVTTDPPTVAGVGQKYTKTPTAYTVADQYEFYKTGTGSVIQMNGVYQTGTSGWATIPGGIIFIWGQFTQTAVDTTINFVNIGYATAGFPNAAFQVICQRQINSGSTVDRNYVVQGSLSQTQFTWRGSNNGIGELVSFLAIGN